MKQKSKKVGSLEIILAIVAIFWAVHFIGILAPLRQYGIQPRTISGLPGIVLAHFLHANFQHLLVNSLSFFTLALLLILLERRKFFPILGAIMLIEGSLTWLLARSANHIGASGLIFGILGYLLLAGFFQRRLKFLAVSVLVLFLYGGMIAGVLPQSPQVSWESHLFGLLSGAVLARIFAEKRKKR